MGAEEPGGSLGPFSNFLCGLGLSLLPGWSSVVSSVKWQFGIRPGTESSFTLSAHSSLAGAAQRRVLGSKPAGNGSSMGLQSLPGDDSVAWWLVSFLWGL